MDVALVSMPLAPIETPSAALGLLQAVLCEDGLEAESFYPNLWYVERAGPLTISRLRALRSSDSAIDWIFGGVAFPDFAPDHAAYLDRLTARNTQLSQFPPDEIRRRLKELRADAGAFVDQTVERILDHAPRIVGVSSCFQQHVASLALLRRLRRRDPSVITMLGGANCEGIMGRTTHHCFPWVDYVVSGEADSFLAPLCRRLLDGGHANGDDTVLPAGVFAPCHRAAPRVGCHGRPKASASGSPNGWPDGSQNDADRASTRDLDSLPLPRYDAYFAEIARPALRHLIWPALPYETSRGCWWHRCTFCGLNGGARGFRAKSPARVLDDLGRLAERYGVRRITLVDNILHPSYFDRLLPALAEHQPGLSLFAETRSDLDETQVERLAAAGVRWINPGIESLHSSILEMMHKGVAAWQNILLLKWARRHGIDVGWNLLVDLPAERDEWYDEMSRVMPALTHLAAPMLIRIIFCRFSEYFEQATAYGLRLTPSELYRYVFPLPEETLADLVNIFEHDGRSNQVASPDDLDFRGRPGLEKVRRAIVDWQRCEQETKPELVAVATADGGVEIRDSRPRGAQPLWRPGRLHAALLRRCDRAPTMADLLAADDLGAGGDAVRRALDELIERRLVLVIDERAVGLVLAEPVAPPPRFGDRGSGLFAADLFR